MDKISAPAQDKFESSFFQLAYDKLQDKLPNLLNYLVGFEVVNKSDDGRKAVGVFGFKSNEGQVLFVPVFFRDGSVKNLDMLYSKDKEQFYPLTEEWANVFLTNSVGQIGQKSEHDRNSLKKNAPSIDLRDLVVPPRTGKMTYASVIDYVKDGDNNVKTAFENLLEKKANFMEAVLKYYPMDKIAEAMAKKPEIVSNGPPDGSLKIVTTENTVEAKKLPKEEKEKLLGKGYVFVDKRSDKETSKFGVMEYENKFTNPQQSGFGEYLTVEGGLRNALFLVKPMNLKSQFSTDKVIVVDLDSEKGSSYVRHISEVFVKDIRQAKDFEKVLHKMEQPSEVTPKHDKWFVLVNENLASVGPFEVSQNFKDDSGLRRLVISKRHVDPSSYKHHFNRFFDQTGNLWSDQFKKFSNVTNYTLVFTKKGGNTLEHSGGFVFVPKGFKLLPVSTEMYDFGECGTYGDVGCTISCGPDQADADARRKSRLDYCNNAPGGRGALTSSLYSKRIFPLTAHSNGSDFFFTIPGKKRKYASATEANIGLVMDFGLREKQAEELVASLVPTIVKHGYIKLGETGDYTPPVQDEEPYTDDFGNPTYTGRPWQNTYNPGDSYTGNPTQKGLAVMPEITGIEDSSKGQQEQGQQAQPAQTQQPQQPQQQGQPDQGQGMFQQEQQARPNAQGIDNQVDDASAMAQNGQKEIFDAQSIATLSKYVNGPDKIVSYMPALITALDKIGRAKFLLNWEPEKFKETFGADDLPEFNEIANNVFKNLGDFILKVKQVNPDISLSSSAEDK